MFEQQANRILAKLEKARKVDKNFQVFGASSHKYRIGKPLTIKEITQFETRYNVILPDCYKTFLLKIGHGYLSKLNIVLSKIGISPVSDKQTELSAAGPFYGIYSLGEYVDELMYFPERYLKNPAVLTPSTTEEEWAELNKTLDNIDDELPDDVFDKIYERERGKIFAGILPLGSQGCTYIHALVVSGDYAGKVINIDTGSSDKPRFCFENNFLDWYERWLDEIISGILLKDEPTWFGYTMGGNDSELLALFNSTQDKTEKLEALYGLRKLTSITENSCCILLDIYKTGDKEFKDIAIKILTKLSYPMARDILKKLIESDDEECLIACQCIYWYAQDTSKTWSDVLIKRISSVNTPRTFNFIICILKEAKVDFSDILKPFCTHESKEIQETARYYLGIPKKKKMDNM